MKKILVIIIFFAAVIFLFLGPLKDFVGVVQSSDIKNCLKIIEKTGTAVETYTIDWGFAPDTENFDKLETILEESYETRIKTQDPWENSFIYNKTGTNSYILKSKGADGVINSPDDINYKNGKFKVNKENKKLVKLVEKIIKY